MRLPWWQPCCRHWQPTRTLDRSQLECIYSRVQAELRTSLTGHAARRLPATVSLGNMLDFLLP